MNECINITDSEDEAKETNSFDSKYKNNSKSDTTTIISNEVNTEYLQDCKESALLKDEIKINNSVNPSKYRKIKPIKLDNENFTPNTLAFKDGEIFSDTSKSFFNSNEDNSVKDSINHCSNESCIVDKTLEKDNDVTDPMELKRSELISQLEGLLKHINKRIRKLEESEQSLDDMMENNSSYILLDKYKQKYVQVWNKLCLVSSVSSNTFSPKRLLKQKIFLTDGNYPRIRAKVARFVNISDEFPDFFDVQSIVENCNTRYKLNKSKAHLESIARDIFLEVGNKLQNRRKADFRQLFGSHLTDNIRLNEDPALKDKELQQKLAENLKISMNKMDEVFNHYASYNATFESSESDDSSRDDQSNHNADTNKNPLLDNKNLLDKNTRITNDIKLLDVKVKLFDINKLSDRIKLENNMIDLSINSNILNKNNFEAIKKKFSKIDNDVIDSDDDKINDKLTDGLEETQMEKFIRNAHNDNYHQNEIKECYKGNMNSNSEFEKNWNKVNSQSDEIKYNNKDGETKAIHMNNVNKGLNTDKGFYISNNKSNILSLDLIGKQKEMRVVLSKVDLKLPKNKLRMNLSKNNLVIPKTVINTINKNIKLSQLLEADYYDILPDDNILENPQNKKLHSKGKLYSNGRNNKFLKIVDNYDFNQILNDDTNQSDEELIITDLRTITNDHQLAYNPDSLIKDKINTEVIGSTQIDVISNGTVANEKIPLDDNAIIDINIQKVEGEVEKVDNMNYFGKEETLLGTVNARDKLENFILNDDKEHINNAVQNSINLEGDAVLGTIMKDILTNNDAQVLSSNINKDEVKVSNVNVQEFIIVEESNIDTSDVAKDVTNMQQTCIEDTCKILKYVDTKRENNSMILNCDSQTNIGIISSSVDRDDSDLTMKHKNRHKYLIANKLANDFKKEILVKKRKIRSEIREPQKKKV